MDGSLHRGADIFRSIAVAVRKGYHPWPWRTLSTQSSAAAHAARSEPASDSLCRSKDRLCATDLGSTWTILLSTGAPSSSWNGRPRAASAALLQNISKIVGQTSVGSDAAGIAGVNWIRAPGTSRASDDLRNAPQAGVTLSPGAMTPEGLRPWWPKGSPNARASSPEVVSNRSNDRYHNSTVDSVPRTRRARVDEADGNRVGCPPDWRRDRNNPIYCRMLVRSCHRLLLATFVCRHCPRS